MWPIRGAFCVFAEWCRRKVVRRAILLVFSMGATFHAQGQLATISATTWTNEIDNDGDGFTRSRTLTWNPDVDNAFDSLNVFETIYFKASTSAQWIVLSTTAVHTITGQATNDIQSFLVEGGSQGTYDFRIDIMRQGQSSADATVQPSGVAELGDQAFETTAQDGVTVTSVSWTSITDTDGDGYARSMFLNWNPNLVSGSGTLNVFERVSWRMEGETAWTTIATSNPHTITGQSTGDIQSLLVIGKSHGTYEYQIEIFRESESGPDATIGPPNNNLLKNRDEELASEDAIPRLVGATWSDQQDIDGDGYYRSMNLNWDSDVSDGSGSIQAFAKIFRRLVGSNTWSTIATTASYTITGQGNGDTQTIAIAGSSHNAYEYLIHIFRASSPGTLDDQLLPEDDSDLANHLEETAGEDGATIANAFWTAQVDVDNDGYYQSMTLNWDSNLANGSGSLTVFEKIYWRPGVGGDWVLISTTAPHIITGQNSQDIQSLAIDPKPHGEYDYMIEVYRQGANQPDATRSTADLDLNDHREESLDDDATAKIADAWWTAPVDIDGDEFNRTAKLAWEIDTSAGNGQMSVFEKVFRRPAGQDQWTVIATTNPHDVTGQTAGDTQFLDIAGTTHGQYDYRVDVFRFGLGTSDDSRTPDTDADLESLKFETAAEDGVSIADAYWTNRLDDDGDGYFHAMLLNWDPTLVSGSGTLSVFEKIYWRPGDGGNGDWVLLTTTSPHAITGQSTADVQSFDVPAKPHGEYDYKIEIFRQGETQPDALVDPAHTNLNNQKEEEHEDDAIAVLVDASWANELDVDGDSFARSATLHWEVDTSFGATQIDVFERVYRKLTSTSEWTLVATTNIHSISGQQAGDVQSLNITGDSHGTYDYRIDVLRSGRNTSDDTRDFSDDLDLSGHKDETAPQDAATIANAWWTLEVDRDGDGYFRSGRLNWSPSLNLGGGSLSVFERVYWRPGAGGIWTLLLQTPVHTITSQSGSEQFLEVAGKTKGMYDYKVEVYREGQVTSDATLDADGIPALDDHKEEIESQDAVAELVDAWWTNEVDDDGDGYFHAMTLNWDPNVSSPTGTITVYEIVYKRVVGDNIWSPVYTTPARTLTGQSNSDAVSWQAPPWAHGEYQYRIDIFRDGQSLSDDTRDAAIDVQLDNHKEELVEDDPIIIIADAWWTNQVDVDEDGYFNSMTLNWNPNVSQGSGSHQAYEKVYWKPSNLQTWTLLTTRGPFAVNGASTDDIRTLDLLGHPYGEYDYRIELLTDLAGSPEYVLDTADADLSAHKEEELCDDAVVRIDEASWTDQVDADGDGYYTAMVLNWSPIIGNECTGLDVFFKIYWRPSDTGNWSLIAVTSVQTLGVNSQDNLQERQIAPHPYGAYDYRIEAYRNGQSQPDDIRTITVDSDLHSHLEELEDDTGPKSYRLYVPFYADPSSSSIEGDTPRSGRATVLNVQNLGSETAHLIITYQWRHSPGETYLTRTVEYDLSPYALVRWRPYRDEAWELNGSTPIIGNANIDTPPNGASGSASIVSNQPVSGYVINYDFDIHGFAAYTMPFAGADALAVPFISDAKTSSVDTATFIGIQNLSNVEMTDLHVKYWSTEHGTEVLQPVVQGYTRDPYTLLPLASVSWRPAIQDLAEGEPTGMRVRGSTDGRGDVLVRALPKAKVEKAPDVLVAGRVLRFDLNLGEMAALTMPPANDVTEVYIPFFSDNPYPKSERRGVASYIGVQNLSPDAVTLNIEYRNPKTGAIENKEPQTPYQLPAFTAVSWRPYADDISEGSLTGQTVNGSKIQNAAAIIRASGPIAGQLFSFEHDLFDVAGANETVIDRDSISLYEAPTQGATALAIPYYVDNAHLRSEKTGIVTFISIQNLSNSPVTLNIDYRAENGSLQNKNDHPNYVIAAHGAVSWRPFANDPAEGSTTGQLVPGSNVEKGSVVIRATSGLIAGRVEAFDFGVGSKASYTMPDAMPAEVE
jgi:hypothetical protein